MIDKAFLKGVVTKSVPAPVLTGLRYPRETLFVKGIRDFEQPQPSVYFFTMHKCASPLMRQILKRFNKHSLHLTHLNLAAYAWNSAGNEPVYAYLSRHSRSFFRDRGILYAPLRDYVDLTHLNDARSLVMLRDPRDILVSSFYSTAYSHNPPANPKRRKAFLAHREHVQAMGLEGHARYLAPILASTLARYRQHFSRDQVVTYEEMWADFPGFLHAIADILGITLTEQLLRELLTLTPNRGKQPEQIHSNRRKGTPGDHRQKMSPSLLQEVNDIFADSLEWLYSNVPTYGSDRNSESSAL